MCDKSLTVVTDVAQACGFVSFCIYLFILLVLLVLGRTQKYFTYIITTNIMVEV